MVAEDGMYRLGAQTMTDAGVPLASVQGSQYQVFHNGKEVPLYVSTNGVFGSGDYLEFYGQKNTAELDRHLFAKPDEDMMNPYYSLFTDTAAYFLTWTAPGGAVARFQNVDNDLNNLPAKEAFCWFRQMQVFNNLNDKKKDSQGVSNSFFDTAEGYSSSYSLIQNVNFTAEQPYTGNQDAKLEFRFACGNGAHNQLIKINGSQAGSENFNGYTVFQKTLDIPNASLAAALQLTLEGAAGNNDKQRIAYAALRYPRLYDFGGSASFLFELDAALGRKYLEINNFGTNSISPVLYDLTNRLRVVSNLDANNLVKIALPASTADRSLILLNANTGAKTVSNITPVSFIDYSTINADYIILSNAKLFDDGTGVNWVQEYANYRASAAGGGFKPVVVEIQQVYEQFGWGINRHALAVRNFAQFAMKYWDSPKYLFIIGKGREYRSTRISSALGNPDHLPLLVSTYGAPGSDNLLTASHWDLKPMIPTGRLPAVMPAEIKLYLDKVKSFEANRNLPQTIIDRQWMKKVMHLGGGGSNEQALIRANLETMGNILENNAFGAEVHSFYKTSTDPIQVSQTQEITDLINNGLSIMTFFGHSSATGFDFVVDDPATYTNYGKYPVVFSLGCFTGQIHDSFRSIGESFVLQENKGAIGFLATSGYGYVHALNQMTSNIYGKIGGDYYGQSIGKSLQAAFGEYQQSDFGTVVLVQQFTYHGDPAIVLNAFQAPDFVINPNTIAISSNNINAQQPDFQFAFKIVNIGKAIPDSMTIEVKRELPNGSVLIVERRKFPSPKYESELTFTIPVLGNLAIGFNKIYVQLDPDNQIEEQWLPQAENNNFLTNANGEQGYRFYVFANGALPVYPENFSIVSEQNIVLKAVTSSVFAPELRYFLELDTTELFDSPFRKSISIIKSGGVVEWTPGIGWSDGTVYYWRISPDTTEGQGFAWANSSFLYLDNSPTGWNQSHYFQVKKDRFSNTELPETTRKLKFLDDVKTLRLLNGVYPTFWPALIVNSESYFYLPWDDPITGGMYITVLDSNAVDPWPNIPPGLYGSHLSPWAYFGTFPFSTQTQDKREQVIHFLRDTVPSGNYVLIFTIQQNNTNNYEPEEWAADSLVFSTNLFQLLEQQGAKLIRSTETTGARPYAILYKKDDPSFPIYEKVVGLDESIEETFSLTGFWYNGFVESTLIGPAKQWDSLVWNTTEYDQVFDKHQIDVYGIKADSSRVLLFEKVQTPSLDLSVVNPDEFPYLRLRYIATDSVERTPPHLEYWRVFFEGLPDAAIDPSANFSFHKDTLQEGENLQLSAAIRNLTKNGMDSLLVRFSVVDVQNQAVEKLKRYAPLTADGQIQADFQLNTKGIRGKQRLWMEVNPDLEQPELHTFNNVAIREFYVETDKRNPVMDVTFDGVHILNGDLVSARPQIIIQVEDENPYLSLDDTSLFKLFLQYPDTSALVAVPFDGQLLRFTPANPQSGKNKAILELSPHFTKDGTYTLIVQSRDASNNASGEYDYKIAFEVITKSMISNMLNYPNPFSTSTRFVYTLTGEAPPAQFKIQILTISGRIVREITQDEIGQLRIGVHQTEYAWDGRDEFGDYLANGIYLYRVLAKKANGEAFELMENAGADKYFKNGYGKMVLIR
jgi:hypothetical protein